MKENIVWRVCWGFTLFIIDIMLVVGAILFTAVGISHLMGAELLPSWEGPWGNPWM